MQGLLGLAITSSVKQNAWASPRKDFDVRYKFLLEKPRRLLFSVILPTTGWFGRLTLRKFVDGYDIVPQQHPVAAITGGLIPYVILGFATYWWLGWRARRKHQRKRRTPTAASAPAPQRQS
jgi:hypothetical protein